MRVDELRNILDSFDDSKEVSISIRFHDFIDWTVDTGAFGFDIHGEDGSLVLKATVYQADFDYPGIMRELKDIVEAIPESVCTPK